MILNDLKSTWRLFKFNNSLEAMSQQDILNVIEATETFTSKSVRRLMINSAMFLFLVICCQGG